jgi:hypothetical protein
LDQIKLASRDPFSNTKLWSSIQLIILKKIISLENKIREINDEIKNLNIKRKNPTNRLTKDESIEVKAKIKNFENKIESIRFVIDTYRSLGDAIAFTFINKFDIKPQNFKQSAGFISKKDGLKKELEMFREIYKHGDIAIINDITSVLKYCDITLVHRDGFIPIEVKSSDVINSRIIRQNENANKIFNYLETDITENLYNRPGVTQRVEITIPEKNYSTVINELIKHSEIHQNALKEVEHGLSYYVSRKFENSFMEENFKNLKKPIITSLNQHKFSGQGYYPFSLSISESEDYYDFLSGKYIIFIIIDLEKYEKHYYQKGYKFSDSDNIEFGFQIEPLKENSPFKMIKLSNHYFLRTAMEFVSLRSIIDDTINQIGRT